MRRSIFGALGAAALLGLLTLAAEAQTAPTGGTGTAAVAAPSTSLPTACQPAAIPSSTAANTVGGDEAATAAVDDNDNDNHGQAVRECVDALHDAGDNGIGEIVSALAQSETQASKPRAEERCEDRHGEDDDVPNSTTAATTSATGATGATTATIGSAATTATASPSGAEPSGKPHGNGRAHEHVHGHDERG